MAARGVALQTGQVLRQKGSVPFSSGITLHIDQGQAPYGGGNAVQDPANDTQVDVDSSFNSGEYFTIKATHFAARHGYFHYCLLADSYSINGSYVNSSGLGELPGDDFIVSMGQWAVGNDTRIGNIFMHELGHNLGLRHGGFENRNYKPNYNSVMNYGYAFCGADGDSDSIPDDLANYSHGVNIALDENQLVEPDGVTGLGPAIDWDNSGSAVDTVAQNINCELTNAFFCGPQARQQHSCGDGFQCYDSSCSLLQDFNDWGSLQLNQLNDADFAPREVIHCVLDE